MESYLKRNKEFYRMTSFKGEYNKIGPTSKIQKVHRLKSPEKYQKYEVVFKFEKCGKRQTNSRFFFFFVSEK